MELSRVPECHDEADVFVRLGATPQTLRESADRGVWYEGSTHEFLLEVPPVARFWIRAGNEITVTPAAASRPDEIEAFLLGSAFAHLLHQRGAWTAHAAAIERDGSAILFAGQSGAGKSTLVAALGRRNHTVRSDDLTPVVVREAQPFALPGLPFVRLQGDSVERLAAGDDVEDEYRRGLDKYELRVTSQTEALPVSRIYLLHGPHDGGFSLDRLEGQAKFRRLLQCTYKGGIFERIGGRSLHFRAVAAVANSVSVTSVRRPRGVFDIAGLADRIEADFAK
jgi:hypothetical protein